MNQYKHTNIIVILLGILSGLGPFSIDMYLPGFPAIARDFQTDIAQVGLTLTSFFIGFASGQLLLGPLLDRFGRKKPLIFGLSLYFISAIGCALSPSIHYFIIFRFFLALGICVGTVGGNSIIRDIFKGPEIARAMSLLGMTFGIAPIIAPSVGGIVVAALGWRYVFVILAIISVFVLISIKFVLPETKEPDSAVSLKPVKVLSGYLRVFKEKRFIVFALANAAAAGGLFSFITNAPFVFIDVYGFTATQFGWIFGANAVLFVIAGQINRVLLKKISSIRILVFVTGMQTIIGILLVTGTYMKYFHIAFILMLSGGYWLFFGFVTPNSNALSLQPFTKNIGRAAALLGSIQMLTGASSSALVSYLYSGTERPMFSIMCGCALISFILFAAGKRYPDSNK